MKRCLQKSGTGGRTTKRESGAGNAVEITKLSKICGKLWRRKKIGEAVRRHRVRERFAFATSEFCHRRERLRVEKEDRLIEMAEKRFYEFERRKGLMRLNQRHYIGLSDDGEALQASSAARSPFSLPLRDRRKFRAANRGDRLEYYARVKQFEKRIWDLKERRSAIQRERTELSDYLGGIHRDYLKLSQRLVIVENEHMRCRGIVDKRKNVADDLKRIEKLLISH